MSVKSTLIKTQTGNIITEKSKKVEKQNKHFAQLLNRPSPLILNNITESEEDLGINLGPNTVTEIKAVQLDKNAKVP